MQRAQRTGNSFMEEEYTVKDLMVNLSDYATVSENASILDAVIELEKSQKRFDDERYRHRAILVLDNSGNVVGKLSQLDVLKALEPRYQDPDKHAGMSKYGFSDNFIDLSLHEFSLWDAPLEHICQKVTGHQVREFMHPPVETECVTEDTSLGVAIHLLIMGNHQSLLVTRDGTITGILRLTDVFSGIFQIIKECVHSRRH